MVACASSFWHWPGLRQLGYAALLGAAATALFAVVYGGADWFTHQHTYRVPVHTGLDLAMPLVPAMSMFYLSLNLMLWMTPFVLRTRRELEALALGIAAATLAAGAVFLILPAADAFDADDHRSLGAWAGTFKLARALALRHNYLPSLHVAYTVICLGALFPHAGPAGKMLLSAWGAAVVASTMLTHQHYVLDVVSGMLLGWAALECVCRRWLARPASQATQEPRASLSNHPGPPA
jgi:membrane-associated phospholipid phosphatase